MVGRIERGMMAGTKQLTERRSYFTPGIAKPIAEAVSTVAEAQKRYEDREKQLVFKRLSLEAQNLQAEQMEKIRTANSVDEIPPMVEEFEKRVKENMDGQKWGEEWMNEMSSSFYTANHNDVARAFRNKEKELAGIELNKTVSAYADNIALSGAERAQELMSEAEGLIDGDVYLTPAEKQKSKENLTRVAIHGMVNHNPAQAIKELSDAHRFRNLGEVERKEYKEQAEKMLKAKQADQRAQQQRAQKAQEQAADNNIRLAEIDLMTGQISQEEAVRRISDWAKVAPKTAQPILARILSGKTGTKKTTSTKLSADEKNVNLVDLQDKYMVLRSNPEATVEEYTELMNEIKDANDDEKLPGSKGQELMNEMYVPLAAMLQGELQGQGESHFVAPDEGIYKVNQFIEKNLALSDKAEKAKTVAERNAAKEENVRRAKQQARFLQLYKDNLPAAAQKFDVQDINQIPNSIHKSEIWDEAFNNAKAQYLGTKYPNVDVAKINPTKIMSRDGVEMVNSGAEDTGKGKPLVDTRIVELQRSKKGRFRAVYADGTKKEITAEEYNALKGVK